MSPRYVGAQQRSTSDVNYDRFRNCEWNPDVPAHLSTHGLGRRTMRHLPLALIVENAILRSAMASRLGRPCNSFDLDYRRVATALCYSRRDLKRRGKEETCLLAHSQLPSAFHIL